jgi:putative hemolysin
MTIALSLALIVALAALSVGLTTLEAAFYLLKRRRLGHVAQQNPRAEMANRYIDDAPALLMPVQIGTYMAHVVMTGLLISVLLSWLGHGAILVALLVMAGYLLVFRLSVPYAIVRRNPERALLVLLPAFDRYARALDAVVSRLRRRAERASAAEAAANGQAGEPGAPQSAEQAASERAGDRLAAAVERFSNLVVRNIMTPRPDMVAVPVSMTVEEVRRVLGETKYSRVPVYRENLDDIVGLVGVRDLVQLDGHEDETIASLVRPVHMVPETKRVADLLRELQAQHAMLAVVIDEYGATAGLVSIEDILEELVGEIKDEYDSEAEPIAREADGGVVVQGRVNVDLVEEALGARLCEEEEEDVGTVGGIVAKVFGRIPRRGERTVHAGFDIEVLDADRKRVKRVRFRRRPVEDAS